MSSPLKKLPAAWSTFATLVILLLFIPKVQASGLDLSFTGSPTQTAFSGEYEYVSFEFCDNCSLDNYTYVLTHSTHEADQWGYEIWTSGNNYTLFDLDPGYHSFGLDYWQNGTYVGTKPYRFEVVIEESGGAPSGGYPETIVGKQPYSLSVNGKGDATLNVPLELIPGVSGFAPSLSIGYNSSDGISRLEQSRPGSTLGYGWSVNGISEIRRCVVGQPSSASIQLNSNDSLCLDGDPLVLVDGNHFSEGALYRTKIHSDLLVEAYLTGSNTLAFKVKRPDGTEVTYGNATKGNGSIPYQWLQTKSTSVDGNNIYYSYNSESSGTETIDFISYSGAKVQFSYEEGRSDAQSVPIGGVIQTQDSLLSKITISMNDIQVREYHFLNETESGLNLLQGIQQCGFDISGTERYCLKPTEFDWNTSGIIYSVGALLKGINDSLGADHVIDYESVSSSGAGANFTENPFGGATSYTSDSQALSGGGVLRYVVSQFRKSSGQSSGYIDTHYAYQGSGRESTNNWGFLGFRSQRITDSLGRSTYIQYRMDYPFLGTVASERRYEAGISSALMSRTDYIYENNPIAVNSDNNVSTDNPEMKSIISPIISDGVILGAKLETFNRTWSSQDYSAGIGGSNFTSNFLSGLIKKERYYQSVSFSVPNGSSWGDYSDGDFSVSGEEKEISSTVDFLNRTSGSKWLVGFVEGRSTTHTNRGYQATENTTSYTRSVSYTPWGDTMRNDHVEHSPVGDYWIQHTYNYDSYGNLIYHYTSGGIEGDRTRRYSNYVAHRYPGGIEDSASGSPNDYNLSKSGFDLRFGRAQQLTDENGRDSSVSYDALGRKKSSTDHHGVETTYGYERAYGISGAAYTKTISTAGKPTVKETFDYNNRLIRSSKQGFDGTYIHKNTVYEVDHGRVEKVSLPYSQSDSPKWIVYQYDKSNRVIETTSPDGSKLDIDYQSYSSNGLLVKEITETVKDSSGSTTATKKSTHHFNRLGHKVASYQGQGSPDGVWTTYDYNAYDQLDTVVVQKDGVDSSVTSYKYDSFGHIKEVNDSNSGTQRFSYHPKGQLMFHYRNNDSEIIEYKYDGYGRIMKRIDTYSDGTKHEVEWSWGAANAPAKLGSVKKGSSYRETYSYNFDSEIETVFYEADYTQSVQDPDQDVDTSPQHNTVFSIDYSYFSNGDLESKSYDQGGEYSYKNTFSYNSHGYLKKVWGEMTEYYVYGSGSRTVIDSTQPVLLKTVNSKNAFGQEDDIEYGNSVRTIKQFDPNTGFLTDIDTNHNSTEYQDNHYDWYSDGTLDTKTAYSTSQVPTYRQETYSYDDLERLKTIATSSGGFSKFQSYNYDDLGNIDSKTSNHSGDYQVTDYNYGESGAGVNAVTSYKVNGVQHSLSYNETGSVERYSISGEKDKFIEYNLHNQPTKIVVGSSINDSNPEVLEEFKYNARRRLSFKRTYSSYSTVALEETVYYFGNVEITSYIRNGTDDGGDTKINVADDVLYVQDSGFGDHEFLHRDYQGSVEVVTEMAGGSPTTTNEQAFGAFGVRESKDWKYDLQWNSTELNAILNDRPRKRLGYTGHLQLARSGFIHMQGRLYDPVLGRFLSPDPIVKDPGDSQNWNRYSYVMNSPTKYVDPTGYEQEGVMEICNFGEQMENGGHCPTEKISFVDCILADRTAAGRFCYPSEGDDSVQEEQNIIKNDYLSWEEADQILASNNDPDLIVSVRADMLVVKQTSNFYVDPISGDARAGGMVMGIPEYLVHGQVTIRDRGDGTYGIYQQQYNFEQRPVNNAYDVIRNIETFVGGVVSSEGTPFWIQYDGNANVIKK